MRAPGAAASIALRMLFGDIGRDGVRMESVRTALALLNEALD